MLLHFTIKQSFFTANAYLYCISAFVKAVFSKKIYFLYSRSSSSRSCSGAKKHGLYGVLAAFTVKILMQVFTVTTVTFYSSISIKSNTVKDFRYVTVVQKMPFLPSCCYITVTNCYKLLHPLLHLLLHSIILIFN